MERIYLTPEMIYELRLILKDAMRGSVGKEICHCVGCSCFKLRGEILNRLEGK